MFDDKITISVGNTPLIKWNNIYLKMENYNPSGSIKDRPALGILKYLIENNIIKKGDTIICPTSGNMGISLGYFSCVFDLKVIIVMPSNMSIERVKLIESYGGKVILSPSEEGMEGSIKIAKELSILHNYYFLDQFSISQNYESHYQTLDEIVFDLPDVDTIICGIGTGGTYIGLKKRILERQLNINLIGFEPSHVSLINNKLNNVDNPIDSRQNKIPGIGSTILPNIVLDNFSLFDNIKIVNETNVYNYWKQIVDSINVGISGAAGIYLANKEHSNKKIVVIIPDGIDRYLSDLHD